MNNLNMFSSLFSFPLLSFSSISSESKIVSSFQLKTTNAYFCTRVCVSCVWAQKREEYAKYSKRKLKNRPIDKCWWLRSFFIVPCNVRFICLFVCLLFFSSLVLAFYVPFENESNLKPLRRRLAKFRFTVAMRTHSMYTHYHSSACVCLFPNTAYTERLAPYMYIAHRTYGVDPLSILNWRKNHMYKHHAHRHRHPYRCHTRWCMVCTVYAFIHELNEHTHTQCRFSMNACFVFLSVSLPRCLCLVHTFLLNVQMCSNNIAFIHNRRF